MPKADRSADSFGLPQRQPPAASVRVLNASPFVLFSFDEVVAFYVGVAVVMAAAQLMTLRAFDLRQSA